MRNHIVNNTDSQNGSKMLETGYWLLHTSYNIVLVMEVGVLPLSGYPVTLIPVPVPGVPVIPVPVSSLSLSVFLSWSKAGLPEVSDELS